MSSLVILCLISTLKNYNTLKSFQDFMDLVFTKPKLISNLISHTCLFRKTNKFDRHS